MLRRYVSPNADSARWAGFKYRPGDIVISTRAKSGTTWMQTICAVLTFGSPRLPGTIDDLSPWLDNRVTPRGEVYARLAAQRHRRIIKTHTPLDGIPLDPRVSYIVVGRHPLDMAVSLYHQIQNGNADEARLGRGAAPSATPHESVRDWVLSWVGRDADPRTSAESLPGVIRHLHDAWERRDEPNVLLVHYADLSADLDGQMRRIADRLGVTVSPEVWPQLVEAATFDRMKSNATQFAPKTAGSIKDPSAFFHSGRSGRGRALLSAEEMDAYRARMARMAPDDFLDWLHRP